MGPQTKRRRRRPELWASEKIARQLGYTVVAGVDEVGMGPLAGPVVAGAVVLPMGVRLPGLDDSKKLTALQRLRLDRLIRRRATAVAVFGVDAGDLDRIGLTAARQRASAGAITALGLPVEYLLVDAWDVPDTPLPQLAVVRGDRTCASIMAASIVAKVHRDQTMIEMDRVYPGYGFAIHKGYATAAHREAIRVLGPSPIHRVSWAPFRDRVPLEA